MRLIFTQALSTVLESLLPLITVAMPRFCILGLFLMREGCPWHHSCIIMRMSRVRQFGQLRSSRGSMRGESLLNATVTLGRPTSANGRYVCVNCVNHSLSRQKALLSKVQRTEENEHLQQLHNREDLQAKNVELRSRRAEELQRRVVADNQTAMQACQQRKRRERSVKDEERKLLELSQNQYQKKLQQDKRREALLRDKWRSDIGQQLSLKRTRIHQEQLQDTAPQNSNKNELARADQAARNQEERLQRYRNDLLNQIKDEQYRRERVKLETRELDIKGCAIVDRAEERARRAKEGEAAQRKQIQEERRQREQQLQLRKAEERRIAEQELARQRAQQQREQQKARDAQHRRESQIRGYLTQIKQQIEDRERHRKTSIMPQPFQEDSFIKQRVIPQQRCDSCERTYPKGYLTRMQEA